MTDIDLLAATAYETGIDPITYATINVIEAYIVAYLARCEPQRLRELVRPAPPGPGFVLVKVWFASHCAAFVIRDVVVTTLQTHMPQYEAPRIWSMTFEEFVGRLGVCASPGEVDDAYVEAYRGLTQATFTKAGRRRRHEVRLSVRRMRFVGVPSEGETSLQAPPP